MSANGHWLDRLALRLTRREALRGALAGTVAVALPLAARTPTARAASPRDCRKGCWWFAEKEYGSRERVCDALAASSTRTALAAGVFPILGVSLIASASRQLVNYSSCLDRNVLQNKADAYDCLQDNCPGFDPRKAGGPCDGCPVQCCTCQASQNGYICCIFECGDPTHNCCPGG